jgi:hypothetical protein
MSYIDFGSEHKYTEWQRQLSGLHLIMMEKSARAGEGGGARPPPFTIFTITYKFWCTLQLRGQIHPLFLLYPFILCGCECDTVMANNCG